MGIDAVGNAGGLLCIWNPDSFKLKECCSSRHFILLSGTAGVAFECTIINIYAPNDVVKRRQLWDLRGRLKTL